MLERVQKQIARLGQAEAQLRASEMPSQQPIDCGGGIYSWNASLHLLNSTLSSNVASKGRAGRGGGVCVGQSAPGGVLIRRNTLLQNIASAAPDSQGVGGGLYAYNTPGIVIEDNIFQENSATSGGAVGAGGGLAVEASPAIVVRDNQVLRNTASAGWEPSTGEGGGASLFHVIGAKIADNMFQENLGGVHGTGLGGALFVNGSGLVGLSNNHVIGNWATMFQMDMMASEGGGIVLIATDHISVTGNVIENNTGTASGPEVGVAYGGGLGADVSHDIRVAGNRFSGNVACLTGNGDGGGASLVKTVDSEVAGNSFAGNVGSLAQAGGSGGGLFLLGTIHCRVQGNAFRDNLASAGQGGDGGGINVSEMGLSTIDTMVDANVFLDNRASADPTLPPVSYGGAFSFIGEDLAFTNNVVAGNSADIAGGVGLVYTRGGEVTNNTLAGNSDAGVLVDLYNVTPITFTNNIVVSHTVGISVAPGVTATVDYTLWQGNDADIAGEGLVNQSHPVTGNPAFVDPAADDYHLTIGSAARDAGDPAGVPPAPDHDADGVARPQGPAVDLGAYEWKGYWLRLPLVFK